MEPSLVLLVEDSPTHQKLLADALRKVGYEAQIEVQPDAEGAWAVVERMLRQPEAAWPRFAVVDIGLPGASGIDLLDRIRHEPGLRGWPVIVLTASRDPDDVAESRMAEATAYFTKPSTPAGYALLAKEILLAVGPQAGWTSPKKLHTGLGN